MIHVQKLCESSISLFHSSGQMYSTVDQKLSVVQLLPCKVLSCYMYERFYLWAYYKSISAVWAHVYILRLFSTNSLYLSTMFFTLISGISYLCPLTPCKSRPSEGNNQAIKDNFCQLTILYFWPISDNQFDYWYAHKTSGIRVMNCKRC